MDRRELAAAGLRIIVLNTLFSKFIKPVAKYPILVPPGSRIVLSELASQLNWLLHRNFIFDITETFVTRPSCICNMSEISNESNSL